MSTKAEKTLTEFITCTKYARYLPDLKRRETYEEIVTRNMNMHLNKFPQWALEIEEAYEAVYDLEVLPSMRTMQFAGESISRSPNRVFNCAGVPIRYAVDYADLLFGLLSGEGMGFSVQQAWLQNFNRVVKPTGKPQRFVVPDSCEGWGQAIRVLVESYTKKKGARPIDFDLREIRPKGARLVVSGGKAPGPEPFKKMLSNVTRTLDYVADKHCGILRPLEAFDIACYMAQVVMAGGIRRAAMICLFDPTCKEMLTAKAGPSWYKENPQRAMCNISALIVRDDPNARDHFERVMNHVQHGGYGEPGVFWANRWDVLTNPCCETYLEPNQKCNLTEINAATVTNQQELNERARVAALIGTLQATYTDFHFLSPAWRETVERGALLGVSMTGIVEGAAAQLDLEEAARHAREANAVWADRLNINPADRVTCIKPAGTTSQILGGVSAGIHDAHAPFYIRRCMVQKGTDLYHFLKLYAGGILLEHEDYPETAFLEFPMKAAEGAPTRSDAITLLERIRKFSEEWVAPGHRKGVQKHNVSCTVSVKDDEWDLVRDWMWGNRHVYNGIALLPYDGGDYPVNMYEEISEYEYNHRLQEFPDIDFTKLVELEDSTELLGELACAGGSCDI